MKSTNEVTTMLSRKEYQTEINELAHDIWNEALESGSNDTDEAQHLTYGIVQEVVGGHRWPNSQAFHLSLLQYTNNYDAFLNIFDQRVTCYKVARQGVAALHSSMVHHAMTQDIQDAIYEVLAA